MRIEQSKPLDHAVAVRLKHTNRDPAEWIGELRDGQRIHLVADKTNILISTGDDLNEALAKAMSNDVVRVPHKHVNRAVPTEVMISATGIHLGPGVEVNGKVPGDVG